MPFLELPVFIRTVTEARHNTTKGILANKNRKRLAKTIR